LDRHEKHKSFYYFVQGVGMSNRLEGGSDDVADDPLLGGKVAIVTGPSRSVGRMVPGYLYNAGLKAITDLLIGSAP
jgi:hypothetical protein